MFETELMPENGASPNMWIEPQIAKPRRQWGYYDSPPICIFVLNYNCQTVQLSKRAQIFEEKFMIACAGIIGGNHCSCTVS